MVPLPGVWSPGCWWPSRLPLGWPSSPTLNRSLLPSPTGVQPRSSSPPRRRCSLLQVCFPSPSPAPPDLPEARACPAARVPRAAVGRPDPRARRERRLPQHPLRQRLLLPHPRSPHRQPRRLPDLGERTAPVARSLHGFRASGRQLEKEFPGPRATYTTNTVRLGPAKHGRREAPRGAVYERA